MSLAFDPETVAREHGEGHLIPRDAEPVAFLSAALRDGTAAETNRALSFPSAAEFAARAPSSPPWLLNGYIAEGAITELAGKVKSSGKTTLLLGMCGAIVRGEPFAGRVTQRTRILYLTEQAAASFREALARAALVDSEDLFVLSWHEAIGIRWPEVVAQAVAQCQRCEARLLVVDTLPQWARIRGDGENSAGEALEALAPLQEAAGTHGIAVVVARHSRKSGGEVGDDGRGSSAFTGAADIVLSLRRADSQGEPNIRVLHALSRFAETPESLALQLTEKGYNALGSEAAVAIEIAKRALLDMAPASEERGVTADELIEAAKVRRTTGQEGLAALLELGLLKRSGEGKRGSPFRYWAPEFVSAAPSNIGAAERIEQLLMRHERDCPVNDAILGGLLARYGLPLPLPLEAVVGRAVDVKVRATA